ncbi:MAG: hypothetical protein MZV65_33905 [Chromatiales bacterium]|nr:hypothetical protein [Chromatiales bacterium]
MSSPAAARALGTWLLAAAATSRSSTAPRSTASARLDRLGRRRRCAHVQSGYLYHYAFAMIIGLFGCCIALAPLATLTGHAAHD